MDATTLMEKAKTLNLADGNAYMLKIGVKLGVDPLRLAPCLNPELKVGQIFIAVSCLWEGWATDKDIEEICILDKEMEELLAYKENRLKEHILENDESIQWLLQEVSKTSRLLNILFTNIQRQEKEQEKKIFISKETLTELIKVLAKNTQLTEQVMKKARTLEHAYTSSLIAVKEDQELPAKLPRRVELFHNLFKIIKKIILKQKIDDEQLRTLQQSIPEKPKQETLTILDLIDDAMDAAQLGQIRQGIENGIPLEAIKRYANVLNPADKMEEYRKILEQIFSVETKSIAENNESHYFNGAEYMPYEERGETSW